MSSSESSSSSSNSSRDSTPEPSLKRKAVDESPDDSSDSESDSEDDTPPADEGDDEPVLSHAQRRKQKKAVASASSDSKSKSKGSGPPSKKSKLEPLPTRQNSVWVGNMSFKTTAENLKTFFAKAGVVTRINLPTKPRVGVAPVENRGFAYVDFASSEEQKAAIGLSEQPLLGRKLLIKDGSDFKGRPEKPATAEASGTHSKSQQKILAAQKQPPGPTLFFGNLGFQTTADGLKTLLEAHRKVKEKVKAKEGEEETKEEEEFIRRVRLGEFEDTGACKGFGFVDFATTEAATQALLDSRNHRLDGRDLVVEYASAAAIQRGASKIKKARGEAPPNPSGRRAPRNIRLEKIAAKQGGKRPREDEDDDEPSPQSDKSPQRKMVKFEEGQGGRGKRPLDAGKFKERGGREPRGYTGKGSRPKPGAALALAKRESVAIVESKGKKITF
ncbi:hypothetical protein DL96DRAFT_1491442 [Flagelloscypha sp. PMI_526]|nr:hypothetical protein DL96DRAFT_1491442 [Flagelloscypha sp. PMI_526]